MRIVLVLVGFLAACTAEELAPSWLVDGPRVMAIRADPPAVRPERSTALRALVTDGILPGVPVEHHWRACAPWVQLRDPDLDCGPEQSVELPVDGNGWAIMSIPALAEAFGIPLPEVGSVLHPCDLETYASVPVVYETRVADRRLIAVKQVPVANIEGLNPAIAALRVDGVAIEWDEGRYRPGEVHTLDVSLSRGSLEVICGRDGDQPEPVRVYVYVNGGELDDSRLDIEHSLDGTVSAESTTWIAPTDGEPVTIWLIATERRGRPGIGTLARTLLPE